MEFVLSLLLLIFGTNDSLGFYLMHLQKKHFVNMVGESHTKKQLNLS